MNRKKFMLKNLQISQKYKRGHNIEMDTKNGDH